MIGLLVRLYPARWRARYGDEFEALLGERRLGPFDVADVLLGAIDAHLRRGGVASASNDRKGLSMSIRLGGAAAMVGGLLWFVGLGTASVLGESWAVPGMTMLLLASIALLVGLVGLSAFQARSDPAIVWAGFAVPAVGAVASIVGIVLMATAGDAPVIAGFSGWAIWALGLVGLMIGSILFAIATWRTAALSRSAAALLGVGSTLCVAIAGFGFAGGLVLEGLFIGLFALTFSAGWIALGWDAVRRDRPSLASGSF
ncbi:MAG: hypothetical protein IVW53_04575 [Chloroflexi bacterium]|nr:hypothetical protein [Chloroflexota bacterium]